MDDSAGNIGVASKTMTITTSNGSLLPTSSVVTKLDGTFRPTFTVSNTIFSGWNIQAM
jgi:hypothetical protein